MALPQTAAEWAAETDVIRMAKCYRGRHWFPKLRLFAIACCRRIWHLIPPGMSRDRVETAERFAMGQATKGELAAANVGATLEIEQSRFYTNNAQTSYSYSEPGFSVASTVKACTLPAEHPAIFVPMHILRVVSHLAYREEIARGGDHRSATLSAEAAQRAETECMATLLRTMVGNPFIDEAKR
ncbi:MAG TPA: hypothetical protein VN688_02585 [Gemmataceae bacterium]|nr:hypothetical protein [Gemmataceae bacterium]